MSLQIVITDAGRAEIINAESNGTAPVIISEIGLGTGQYAASVVQTSLHEEFKRLSTISGAAVGDDTIHVTARDEGEDAYQVYEIGLYLDSGTLFAVYSQYTSIIDKSSASVALLAVDIALQSINPASVTFGDANFTNPPATTTTEGVVELATNAETQTGTDSSRVVTPSGLSSRTATTTRTGLVELATTAEAQAGTDSSRAVTPAGVKAAINSSAPSNASTTVKGIVELATNNEAQAGTDSSRAVTPASLASVKQSSQYDTSAGRFLVPGSFGWGGTSSSPPGNNLDLADNSVPPALYAVASGTAGKPSDLPSDRIGQVLWGRRTSGGGEFQLLLIEGDNDLYFRTRTVGAWPDFKKVIDESDSANTTTKGIVELATTAEAQAGTDSSRAVTPAGVKAAIDQIPGTPSASTTTKGIVELATYSETRAGTDSTRAVTPGGLQSYAENRNLYGEDNNEMIGSVAYFITTVAPDGWIKANGAAVSRTTYAKLFAKVGTFWGSGNGSTTFNVPDLRGEFIRCWDDGRGVDSSRAFGSYQADELKSHRHSFTRENTRGNSSAGAEDGSSSFYTDYTDYTGGNETRPRNVALVAYIKY